jgi:hypothetical protein
VAVGYNLEEMHAASRSELDKIQQLRRELSDTLTALAVDLAQLESDRGEIVSVINATTAVIEQEIQPRVRQSAAEMQQHTAVRDRLLRAKVLTEQLDDLQSRFTQLTTKEPNVEQPPLIERVGSTTAGMEKFVAEIEDVLKAWNLPGMGRVVFSEATQDIVIGGKERASHGKGVRALTCSAFIAGLMRHCVANALPHPGFIVLDSPLVSYKDPDILGSEAAAIRKAGVKEAFYRSLAAGLAHGQVIVLENEDPPSDLTDTSQHHFSKSRKGRYGFFPV